MCPHSYRNTIIGSSLLLLCALIGGAKCLALPSQKQVISKKHGVPRDHFVLGVNDDGRPGRFVSLSVPGWVKQGPDINSIRNEIHSVLLTTFLPAGYPSATPSGYLKYAMFSAAQDLSTQMRGVLATQKVLEGLGVGSSSATALSASLNFIVRDGAGMFASLVFTSAAASKFRADIKRWRLFADLIVDAGITLEVVATLFPKKYFLLMICLGNMCKAMCGVAAGACGGAINLHWAKGSDISDIGAKFGAQVTVMGAIGLLFAAFFAKSVSEAPPITLWTLYAGLTGLHICANAQCMRLVVFDGLNTSRMMLLVSEFLEGWKGASSSVSLRDPTAMSKIEPLSFFWRRPKSLTRFPVLAGISFNEFARLSGEPFSSPDEIAKRSTSEKYLVGVGRRRYGFGHSILLSYFESASPEERGMGYLHALLLCRSMEKRGFRPGRKVPHFRSYENIRLAEADAKLELDRAWPTFRAAALGAGWNLSATDLSSEGYELVLS